MATTSRRQEMGASEGSAARWVPRSREYTLRLKREVRESQLAYARETGDRRMVAECERALATIARWEREAS